MLRTMAQGPVSKVLNMERMVEMARKWEISPGNFAWNFEKCEELVLIAGYEEIKAHIPAGSGWMAEFEGHFYQHGNGIAFGYIDEINAIRRRTVLPKLEFKESDVLEYARSTNKMMKSEHRQRLRDEFLGGSTDARLRMLAHAASEMKCLPPPHIPYEQYVATRRKLATESEQSREQVSRRLQVYKQAEAPAARPAPSLAVEKAAKMLRYATDAGLKSKIISHLSSDDALAVIDQVEDADLRDALIHHSLALESRSLPATQAAP